MMGMGMDPVAILAIPFPVPALPCTDPAPVLFNHSNHTHSHTYG